MLGDVVGFLCFVDIESATELLRDLVPLLPRKKPSIAFFAAPVSGAIATIRCDSKAATALPAELPELN